MKIKISLLLVLLAAGCNRSKEEPVCIASYAGTLESFPFDMAQDLGYFREEGVQVTLEALRIVIGALSPDGRMPPSAAEAVQRVVSSADERVLKIDLASTYTNQFLEPK